jgi:hypothetical protein
MEKIANLKSAIESTLPKSGTILRDLGLELKQLVKELNVPLANQDLVKCHL